MNAAHWLGLVLMAPALVLLALWIARMAVDEQERVDFRCFLLDLWRVFWPPLMLISFIFGAVLMAMASAPR